MRDIAERLRQMPGRLGVCGITLVKNGESGLERRIAQVFIKLGELPRRQEALVDNRLRGERANIASRGQERFGALPQKGQPPLEARGSARRMERLDEKLPNLRHGFERAAA